MRTESWQPRCAGCAGVMTCTCGCQPAQLLLEETRQRHGLVAQPLDARLQEHRERGDQRRRRQHRRIAQLPGRHAGGGAELRLHEKARGFLVAPPARQARARDRASVRGARQRPDVALVHETAADGPRSGVQVLVAAPHGEVRVRLVQGERQVADRVRQVEAGHAPVPVGGTRDARQIERLPGAELHRRPQHQGDLRAVLLEARLDRALRHAVFADGGASSISASAGSRPCQARCEVTAWRSEEKAPASMRMRRRAPCGR